jgi:hypothetical protein
VLLLSGHWFLRDLDFKATLSLMPWWLRSVVLAVLLLSLTLAPGDDRAFIYFQF